MAKIVPIKKETHQNTKIAAKRSLSHLANQHIIPVTAREFAQAQTSYPIVVVKEPGTERLRAICMLGLEVGENLYYSEDKWEGIYIPQGVSMVPFALGLDPDKENTLTACVDEESEYVGEDKDNALFDAEGNETDYLKSIHEALGRLYENEVATEGFVKELMDNDLLMELELQISFSNNDNKKLVGLYGIDEQKLQALSEEKVVDFHKRGLFIPIHAMLGSIGQIHRLAQLRNAGDNPVKVTGIQFKTTEQEQK